MKNIAETNESYTRAENVTQLTKESKERTKGLENENVITGRKAKWFKDHPTLAGIAIGLQQFDTGNVNTLLKKLIKYEKNEKKGKNKNQGALGAVMRYIKK